MRVHAFACSDFRSDCISDAMHLLF
jgi:hypothetical protein